LGELLNLEKRTEQFGSWLKVRTKSDKDAGFVEGFVTASLTICIGAMAVINPAPMQTDAISIMLPPAESVSLCTESISENAPPAPMKMTQIPAAQLRMF